LRISEKYKIKINSVDEHLVGAGKWFSIEKVKKCDVFSQKIIYVYFMWNKERQTSIYFQ